MSVGLPLTIPNAFARNARWFAGGEAVVDSTTRLTYSKLDDLSLRTAALFVSLGAEPGKPLALLCVPSSIYLVAWLGAIRMGALPMALHTRESAPTLAAICRKMGPGLLVYDASMEALASDIVANYSELRALVEARSALPPKRSGAVRPIASIPADLPATQPLVRQALPAEDDPAVIVLSSGTTSVAKGVVHTHRGFIENARTNLYMYQGVLPRDRSLVPLSTAFIGCYNGWFPFLNAGACTIFMEHFDLDELPRRVSAEGATHVFLTPTLWRRILNAEDASTNFRSVRLIGFAAEPMDATTLKRLREQISPNIVQVYGSTEIGAAATSISAEEMIGDRLVSVGRPLVNGDLRIVTPGGRPEEEVTRGEIGEVLVSSPSLAAGIWRDMEATANSFVVDGDRRWWRSRDLGRLDAGGYLYLEGRRDDMIISGGINIMPARVEDTLLAHPGVAECAVVGVPHPEWGEEVQAFVVRRDPKLDAEAMELYVRSSDLSPYQRPRLYHFVAELPRTSSNKVLRRVLREEASSKPKSDTDFETITVQTTGRKMSEPILLTERRGAIAIVTLNRPDKRNALSEALWGELKKTFENFEPDVRCVVLAGTGKHFCAGLDLSEHRHREAFESIFMSRFAHATLEAIQFGGRPVVTAMQGAVIGGGLEVATATHVRVADSTTFYQLPEGRRGFYVGGGASVRVARIIGSGRMVEMMLTGRTLDAAAGERLGLSHYLVEPGKTLEKAIELAENIAKNARIPNYLIVQAIPRIEDMSAADGLWTESVAQAISMTSEDARAGIDAFFGKRKIDF